MRSMLHRLLARHGNRAFDAAGGGRRCEGARTVDGLITAIPAGATTAARRVGWCARNNPWVAAAVDSLVGNVVGAGIKPQCTHAEQEVRERAQVLWLRCTDHADPSGLADFYGLQAMAMRSMVNRAQVRDSAAILTFLMPVLVGLMMNDPSKDWDKPFYPVVS